MYNNDDLTEKAALVSCIRRGSIAQRVGNSMFREGIESLGERVRQGGRGAGARLIPDNSHRIRGEYAR